MFLGIIGGTGLYELLDDAEKIKFRTPYGYVILYRGLIQDQEIAFLPRHGVDHDRLPREVNYLGNIYTLKQLGITRILATSAAGSFREEIKPGDFFLPDQFFGFLESDHSFRMGNVEITDPYCNEIRDAVKEAATMEKIPLHVDGIYLGYQSYDRYETAAEIRVFKSWGMDVVGQTNHKEAILARQLRMCYAVIIVASNYVAGISKVPLSLENHRRVVQQSQDAMFHLVKSSIPFVTEERNCKCIEQMPEIDATALSGDLFL